MRDHGGNLDWAMAKWGGRPEDWLDLSTGINPAPYPLPAIPARAWSALPTSADIKTLSRVSAKAYGTTADILPTAGAQAAIQMLPRVLETGRVRILGPTYNEHAGSFSDAGWNVETVASVAELGGDHVAVVVNPNNPDGRILDRKALIALSEQVRLLIVDESFADPMPNHSVADLASDRLLVLRSFGKFFGLAGLRLGFLIGGGDIIDDMRAMVGPWPVSGAAIAVGQVALADQIWHKQTVQRLAQDAAELDRWALAMGYRVAGGTTLFRLYEADDAAAAQARLAEARIWSRIFPYSDSWLRLGLPGEGGFARLQQVLD